MNQWLFVGAGCLLAATAALSDTVSLAPVADNTLYDHVSGALSGGLDDSVYTGMNDDDRVTRAVVRFDVAGQVPAGATITSAVFRMTLIDNNNGPQDVYVYRLGRMWGEGSSISTNAAGAGGTSTVGSATWIHTFYTTGLWDNVGGDFTNVQSAFLPVSALGTYEWSSASVIADVQTWLDQPATNFGWLAKNNSEAAGQLRFASREFTTPASRPTLVIGYLAPAVAHEAIGGKRLTNGFETTWSTVSGQVYEVDFSTNITVNPQVWTPLVTVTANSAAVSVTDTNAADRLGYYRMLELQL